MRNVFALVTALVIAAIVVGVALSITGADDEGGGGNGVSATVEGVEIYEDLARDHVGDDVDYDQSPPVGGEHDDQWLACGAYDEPVRAENVVHSLEHGTVWITYQPDLPADQVEALSDALPDEGILSPYPDLESPVVVTVWGAQIALEGADDPRLEEFIDEYGDDATAPEPFASCEGGLTSASGG